MKNEIKVFDFENSQIRTVVINNEPWFIGKDVCVYFGDTNHKRSLSRIDDNDKQIVPIQTNGGTQNLIVVNESGLYSLLFAMQPQKANHTKGESDAYPLEIQGRIDKLRKFKRWVTSEVLPTLRKTGGYINNTQLFIDTYFSDVDDAQKSLIANCMNQISEKQKQINLMQPKYDYCNEILTTENVVPITVIAKDYGMSATKLNQLLKDLDVQYKVGGVWVLKKKYANKGYTATKTGTPENGGYSYTHTYWTQAGRFFIYNLLKEHGIVPLVEQNNNKALTVNH
jgi:prophage antirepressor-like protein